MSSSSPSSSSSSSPTSPSSVATTIDSTTLHYRLLTLLKQYDNRLCADCKEVLVVQHHYNSNHHHHNHEHKDGLLNDCIYASLTYGVIYIYTDDNDVMYINSYIIE
jgi:hypothetical protein